MKMRLMTLLLALAMTVSLTACGGNGASSAQGGTSSAQTSADTSADQAAGNEEALPEEEPEDPEEPEETQNAVEEPSGENTEAAQKPPAPVEKPAEKPAEKPVQKPAEEPEPAEKPVSGGASGSSSADTGSQAPAAQSVDLTAFYESQTTAYGEGNFPAMMALDGEALDVMYPGLSDLSPKQCLVYMPMISAVAAEYALVEVSSADQVETVKTIFQSRIDYQVEQGAFYPATVEKWQNSTRIVSNGNYVMLVCFDRCDDAVSSFNALF
ncbi:DUF4358 domain-containing protein [Dysosmobacter sp.]|uniref:DUF4358 domain-containing protein n=1 Tax=Dysosmobacter sp. TaxID=2591382 RepID=UPI002A8BAD03|nr:DUF4358 domain-containing protein [Dysosmobacter sp.]MDY3282002.1 DUF4358 domain-containing protein [Dysosmobacter sp.]